MHFKIEDNLFSFVAYNVKYVMLSRKLQQGKDSYNKILQNRKDIYLKYQNEFYNGESHIIDINPQVIIEV